MSSYLKILLLWDSPKGWVNSLHVEHSGSTFSHMIPQAPFGRDFRTLSWSNIQVVLDVEIQWLCLTTVVARCGDLARELQGNRWDSTLSQGYQIPLKDLALPFLFFSVDEYLLIVIWGMKINWINVCRKNFCTSSVWCLPDYVESNLD